VRDADPCSGEKVGFRAERVTATPAADLPAERGLMEAAGIEPGKEVAHKSTRRCLATPPCDKPDRGVQLFA
jgi:hypothetical protein